MEKNSNIQLMGQIPRGSVYVEDIALSHKVTTIVLSALQMSFWDGPVVWEQTLLCSQTLLCPDRQYIYH